jgi:hypothetical protein
MRHLCKFVTVVLLLCTLTGCEAQHPKDEVLLKNFRDHKAEFEQLLQMFHADKRLSRVARDFTRPANPTEVGITEERLREYRKLFDVLGLSAGIEGYGEKESVFFLASTQGLSVSGSSKGYAYLATPPELIVDQLDGYKPPDGKSFSAFRRIEGNWYLHFDYED